MGWRSDQYLQNQIDALHARVSSMERQHEALAAGFRKHVASELDAAAPPDAFPDGSALIEDPEARRMSEVLRRHWNAVYMHTAKKPESWLVHPLDYAIMSRSAAGNPTLRSLHLYSVRLIEDSNAMRIGGR